MKTIINILSISALSIFLLACGGDELARQKEELETKQKELASLKKEISELEKEIAQKDPDFNKKEAEILVAGMPVNETVFRHQIDVRGSVTSRKNVLISSQTMGRIEKIYVKEGDYVKTGATLVKLDDDIIRNNIEEVKTQLELTTTVFERQKNLWDQNIGTEIQYLQAKNNKESLERRLETLQSQLNQYYVKAPFSGNVDAVPVKMGEMAQPGVPLIRVVNPDDMYIQAEISEAYLGSFKKGDKVEVYFPIQDQTFYTEIISVSKVIKEENRTFAVEISLPSKAGFQYQPNQVVVVKLTDYINEDAIAVPTKLIQTDNEGKFVYVIEDDKKGMKKASKVRVQTGMNYESKTEILNGLSIGQSIIAQGYRDVNDGVIVKLASK